MHRPHVVKIVLKGRGQHAAGQRGRQLLLVEDLQHAQLDVGHSRAQQPRAGAADVAVHGWRSGEGEAETAGPRRVGRSPGRGDLGGTDRVRAAPAPCASAAPAPRRAYVPKPRARLAGGVRRARDRRARRPSALRRPRDRAPFAQPRRDPRGRRIVQIGGVGEHERRHQRAAIALVQRRLVVGQIESACDAGRAARDRCRGRAARPARARALRRRRSRAAAATVSLHGSAPVTRRTPKSCRRPTLPARNGRACRVAQPEGIEQRREDVGQRGVFGAAESLWRSTRGASRRRAAAYARDVAERLLDERRQVGRRRAAVVRSLASIGCTADLQFAERRRGCARRVDRCRCLPARVRPGSAPARCRACCRPGGRERR